MSGAPAPPADTAAPLGLPTFPFISHAYADQEALAALLSVLPSYVKPIVFEPIETQPTEFVSDKLVSGLLGANGFIFIDSPASRASFWTAFERDLAERNNKQMYRFDPDTGSLSPYAADPRTLLLGHLYHPRDHDHVAAIMTQLVQKRSIVALDGGERASSAKQFNAQDPDQRAVLLHQLRSKGGIYLIFVSRRLLKRADLCKHAADELEAHPQSTLLCWIEQGVPLFPSRSAKQLMRAPAQQSFQFDHKRSGEGANVRQLDDLMVRVLWLLRQPPPSDSSQIAMAFSDSFRLTEDRVKRQRAKRR